MKKIKIYLKMILELTLVLISIVGVVVLGHFFSDKLPFKNVITIIVSVLYAINIVSNIIINKKDFDKVNAKKSGDELLNILLETKEEALKDPEVIRERTINKYNKIRLYSYVTLFLMYLLLFLWPYPSVLSHVLILVVFFYFYSIINSKRKEELEKNNLLINTEINKDEFKELYDIVDSVIRKHNVNKKYKIVYDYTSNLSINEQDEHIIIFVGYYVLRLLTKKELEAALHHEIAHFINSDTDYSLKFSKLHSNIAYLSNSFLFKIFYPNIYSLTFETELLNYLSTIFYERKADDIINQVGCNQDFINGLAKVYIYGLYYEQYLEDISLGRFNETNYNVLNVGFNDFLRYYNNNLDYINIFLEKSMVGRFDTHPSIVERKERLNVDKIEVSFAKDEFKHLADLIEEKFIKDNKANIEEQYKNVREEYLKALKDFESINENTTLEELISLEVDLFRLSLYEKALIVCNKVLEINPDQARTCFIKGAILLNLYHNEEGITYLYRIIEENHSEHLTEAIQILGTYYSSIGNMEGIEKLRSVQTSSLDNYSDYDELSQITQKDNLVEVSDDEGINKVLEIVKDSAVTNAVVTKKIINNKEMIHVILVFNDKEKGEVVDDINNKVWSTLDAINDKEYYLRTIGLAFYKNLKWLHKFEVYKNNNI